MYFLLLFLLSFAPSAFQGHGVKTVAVSVSIAHACNAYLPHFRHVTGYHIYRVSQEEWTKLRESVPYVKIYRYNQKHLYPNLNGYGDNGHRKVWASGGGPLSVRRP